MSSRVYRVHSRFSPHVVHTVVPTAGSSGEYGNMDARIPSPESRTLIVRLTQTRYGVMYAWPSSAARGAQVVGQPSKDDSPHVVQP